MFIKPAKKIEEFQKNLETWKMYLLSIFILFELSS